MQKKGSPYGTHRVISPKGVLPQPADVIDNDMEIYDNEVLIDVQTLNIDSASFTEIERRANGDIEEIKKTHGDSKRAKEYLAIADLMELHFSDDEEKREADE